MGYARRQETLEAGIRIGAFDEASDDLADAVREADLVMVAAPVRAAITLLEAVATHLSPGAIVTDVGSTKAAIALNAARVLPPGCFIGGHPMAGSHRSGINSARADLFVGARYLLTRSPAVPASAAAIMESLVRSIGAEPLWMEPQVHDRLIARASHLPHVAASALVEVVGASRSSGMTALELAAAGFRDTTRVAAGDPVMWTDIIMTNPEEIITSLDAYLEALARLRDMVVRKDERALTEWLAAAAAARRALEAADSGE